MVKLGANFTFIGCFEPQLRRTEADTDPLGSHAPRSHTGTVDRLPGLNRPQLFFARFNLVFDM